MDSETGAISFYILTKESINQSKNNLITSIVPIGTLLVEQKKRSKQESILKLNTFDFPTKIEVKLSHVSEISQEDFYYLLAVPSFPTRLNIFNKQENFKQIKSLEDGMNVKVKTKHGKIKGVLMYKGPVENKVGFYFGVQFEVPCGNCDGKPHFNCKENHAVYVSMDLISFCEINKNPLKRLHESKPKEKNEAKTMLFMPVKEYNGIYIGMNVFCNVSRNKSGNKGSVCYIGVEESKNKVVFGVQLDEKPNEHIDSGKIDKKYELVGCPNRFDYLTTDINSLNFDAPKENESTIYSTIAESSILLESEKNEKINDIKQNNQILAKKNNEIEKVTTVQSSQRDEPWTIIDLMRNRNNNNLEKKYIKDSITGSKGISSELRLDVNNMNEKNISCNKKEISNPIKDEQSSSIFLQIGDLVEFEILGHIYKGVLKWKGFVSNIKNELAGIELDDFYPDLGCSDGTFSGERWFTCSYGKGCFVKLKMCKPDSRFQGSTWQSNSHLHSEIISGCHPPPNKLGDKYIGNMKGIQGHINSCYMDATLYAMFAFNSTFDFMLYQKSFNDDFCEHVRKCLHINIVNPLRVNGFVKQTNIMELQQTFKQHTTNNIREIVCFFDKEKDPVEFISILLEKVLRVEPLIILRSQNQEDKSVNIYNIIADINPFNPQPSIQYLIELSFISNKLQLLKVPSVMIVQLPHVGPNKIFNRIQITPTLDLSPFLIDAEHLCLICGDSSSCYCKNCACEFGWNNVYTYLCKNCWNIFHHHHKRHGHEMVELSSFSSNVSEPSVPITKAFTTMELFAVICIKKNHYVSFVKCGEGDEASWVFFDSIADKYGDYDGYNIPKVIEVPKLKDFLMATPLDISNLKKEDEYALRLFEDAFLCFYRNTQLSM